MMLFCWKLMFINLLFETSIYPMETKLKYSRSNRKAIFEPYMTPSPTVVFSEQQTPDFKKEGRRISVTKCLEYIWERNNGPKIQTDSRIKPILSLIGGKDTLRKKFPHMGALGWKSAEGTWIFKCGSSLISPKFSLTAAHCSKIPLDSTIVNQVPEIVRLGENIIREFPRGFHFNDANILRIIVHPQYTPPKKYYDIALVEFISQLQFSGDVRPVCLWNSFNTSNLGTKFTSTGWGVVNTTTRMTSATLQVIEIDMIDSKLCDKLLDQACNRHWCGLQEHQLCAGKLAGGVDACQGDSGGPLQVKINLSSSNEGTMHYLIGVTSFGIGCARPNLPGVYVRVSSFVDWIESIVWPEQL